jgi:hypothetical protein
MQKFFVTEFCGLLPTQSIPRSHLTILPTVAPPFHSGASNCPFPPTRAPSRAEFALFIAIIAQCVGARCFRDCL